MGGLGEVWWYVWEMAGELVGTCLGVFCLRGDSEMIFVDSFGKGFRRLTNLKEIKHKIEITIFKYVKH